MFIHVELYYDFVKKHHDYLIKNRVQHNYIIIFNGSRLFKQKKGFVAEIINTIIN